MPSTEELKDEGYLERRELVEKVSRRIGIHERTLSEWINGPLSKIRAMLVDRDRIVLPNDREWSCLYEPRLVDDFAAFYKKHHKFNRRQSVVMVVMFFRKRVDDRQKRAARQPGTKVVAISSSRTQRAS